MNNDPRLDPRCDDLGYSLRRYFVDCFYHRESAGIPEGSTLLDLGGTRVAKRGYFAIENLPLKVVSANCSPAAAPDVIAVAEELPFVDGTFDAVICSELLEHVYSPARVIDEVRRVMVPGGILLITVPFLVGIHADPGDYGRYTEQFWRKLLAEKGFELQRLERQGAFWSVVCDLLRIFAVSLRRDGLFGRVAVRLFCQALRVGRKRALAFESAGREEEGRFRSGFTTGYGIVARKKLPHEALWRQGVNTDSKE